MAYHIRHSRGIHCEECVTFRELLSPTDKMAKEEAEEIGWRHTRKGWMCPDCVGGIDERQDKAYSQTEE